MTYFDRIYRIYFDNEKMDFLENKICSRYKCTKIHTSQNFDLEEVFFCSCGEFYCNDHIPLCQVCGKISFSCEKCNLEKTGDDVSDSLCIQCIFDGVDCDIPKPAKKY